MWPRGSRRIRGSPWPTATTSSSVSEGDDGGVMPIPLSPVSCALVRFGFWGGHVDVDG
jgi:hypothetical protein